MRPVVLALIGCAVACASSRPVVAPTAAAPSAPQTLAGTQRTQEFDFTEELRQGPPPPNGVTGYELPPAFAQLSPRDRERWHACHVFFLGIRDGNCGFGREMPLRMTPWNAVFTVTPAEYVATPDAARRAFLIQHGCPDSLVDLADGTHLDLIEHPE